MCGADRWPLAVVGMALPQSRLSGPPVCRSRSFLVCRVFPASCHLVGYAFWLRSGKKWIGRERWPSPRPPTQVRLRRSATCVLAVAGLRTPVRGRGGPGPRQQQPLPEAGESPPTRDASSSRTRSPVHRAAPPRRQRCVGLARNASLSLEQLAVELLEQRLGPRQVLWAEQLPTSDLSGEPVVVWAGAAGSCPCGARSASFPSLKAELSRQVERRGSHAPLLDDVSARRRLILAVPAPHVRRRCGGDVSFLCAPKNSSSPVPTDVCCWVPLGSGPGRGPLGVASQARRPRCFVVTRVVTSVLPGGLRRCAFRSNPSPSSRSRRSLAAEDPERSLTEYIHHLEALQERLGGLPPGDKNPAQLLF
ncbi:hypothetical protein J0S82_007138 [Galemys pyrenaicus]|uniref:Uncharacterized protein n=1 Tax=Galemys pyrenaicus TaxID=202257 RepID=A0A8J6AD05_GALPY|nr:hypothetical protein J0S82_007138 [Galemys pyrenaicus]